MAIAFVRAKFVKRSKGQNACLKSAYNARDRVFFHGTKFAPSATYDFSHKEKPFYSEILLPDHVDEKFKGAEVLWNEAEQKENRCNSQVAIEKVLALPNDPEITNEDRIEIAKTYFKKKYTDNGLAVQIDLHLEGNNCHAHGLATTRRFTEDGKELGAKARDLLPELRNGYVINGCDTKDEYVKHQNDFFESKGLSLRVDPEGIVKQKHLGPTRLRGQAIDLINENERLIEANRIASLNAKKIIENIVKTKSIFTNEDVERYLAKHVDSDKHSEVFESFWKQEEIVPLIDRQGNDVSKFTTKKILEEEKNIIYLADKIHENKGYNVNVDKFFKKFATSLTDEQKAAFKNVLKGSKLTCIEGHAGTGKSYLLKAIKNAYEANGSVVRGFGPDNATVHVLKEIGFEKAENIHQFLFAFKHRNVEKNNEVWIIDESSKLDNGVLAEFLKQAVLSKAQVIFSGCSSQFGAVGRGNMFTHFSRKYGALTLENIQRQKEEDYLEIAKKLAHNEMGAAINKLAGIGGMRWTETKQQAIQELVRGWTDGEKDGGKSIIIAYLNKDVREINALIHHYRKEKGDLGREFDCGHLRICEGDRILFKENNEELKIHNGQLGTLVKATPKKFHVLVDGPNKEIIEFNPSTYKNFQLGYARTFFGSQGLTVDRAYVLFSKHLNKEAFYVGLTRQAKKAFLFVPSEEAKNLASLKWFANRSSSRETTLDYQTEEAIKQEQMKAENEKRVQSLVESDSIKKKMEGYLYKSLNFISSKVESSRTFYKMTRQNEEFYNFKKSESENKSSQMLPLSNEQPPATVTSKRITDYFNETYEHIHNKAKALIHSLFPPNLVKEIIPKETMDPSRFEKQKPWTELSQKNKNLIEKYFHLIDEASNLREVINAQAKELNQEHALEENSPVYSDWLGLLEKRNFTAYQLTRSLSKEDLCLYLGKHEGEAILSRGVYYEKTTLTKKQFELENRARNHVEELITLLFPNQKMERKGHSVLIDAEKPISLVVKGQRAGMYYELATKDSGGIFKLAKERLKLEDLECIHWLDSFLNKIGVAKSKDREEAQKDWVSLKTPQGLESPKLASIAKSYDEKFQEIGRYAYKDKKGNTLFYKLDLIHKEFGTRLNLPLTYGYYKDDEAQTKLWSIRGYFMFQKPLYNLPEIHRNEKGLVLIVEGEEVVDQIKEKFSTKNIICTTWDRSPSSVKKTDWSALTGRDVVIWPTNDAAGYSAAEKIKKDLRKAGANTIGVVNIDHLRKEFPDKWTLASPLPKEKTMDEVDRLIKQSCKNTINLSQIIEKYKLNTGSELDKFLSLRVSNLCTKIEERTGKEMGTDKENTQAILTELDKIFMKSKDNSKGIITENMGYLCLYYQAVTGQPPSQKVKQEIIDILSRSSIKSLRDKILPEAIKLKIANDDQNKSAINYIFDKSVSELIESVLIKSQSLVKLEGGIKYKALNSAAQLFRQVSPEKDIVKEEISQHEVLESSQTPEANLPIVTEKPYVTAHEKRPKDILDDYLKHSHKAASAYKIFKSQESPSPFDEKNWKKACIVRNETAYQAMRQLSGEKIKDRLSTQQYKILQEQASRHESNQQQKIPKETNRAQLELKLFENMDRFLGVLFPDGPTSVNRSDLRFGSNGSLKVAIRGDKAGSYYNFETSEGGGLLKLAQTTLGLNYAETLKWTKTFLGDSYDKPVFPRCRELRVVESKEEWVSLVPPSNLKAPNLKEISYAVDQNYREVARYSYHNENGDILFYMLRLANKENGKKSFVPLSYGHRPGQDEKKWISKRYQERQNTLYNLHLLNKNPTATILVVEGEKTADAANKIIEKENIVCMTWIGGAGAVTKSNWEPLQGRKVIIWPDNDQAGYKAAEELCSLLRQVGVSSLQLVDKNLLAKELPEKWDLADPLPEGKNEQFLKDMLLRAKEKSTHVDQFLLSLNPTKKFSAIEKHHANEILWRVEERLRPDLELKDTKPWEIGNHIIKEARDIYLSQQDIETTLLENGASGDVSKRLVFHVMLYQARFGELPTQDTINGMKETLVELAISQSSLVLEGDKLGIPKEVTNFALDKMLAKSFSAGKYRNSLGNNLDSSFRNAVLDYAKAFSKSIDSDNSPQLVSRQIESSKALEMGI